MKSAVQGPASGWVACETCLAKVREVEAIVREEGETVAFFCSLDCCERWERGAERAATPSAAPEPGVHHGAGRGRGKDERVKRLIRQHPQRDEPLLDSVERDDIP